VGMEWKAHIALICNASSVIIVAASSWWLIDWWRLWWLWLISR
jgi:hypothetical protein